MRRTLGIAVLSLCLFACGDAEEAATPAASEDASSDIGQSPDVVPGEDALQDPDDAQAEDTGAAQDAGLVPETSMPVETFSLASSGFGDGDAIPADFACCNGSPDLTWTGAPEDTKSFALIMDDPDANDFPHWAVFNLPGSSGSISAAVDIH